MSIPRVTGFALAMLGAVLSGQAPLQTGTELPGILDLRDAAAAAWVPDDSRDPAQVQAKTVAWARKVAPLQGRSAVRILLPRNAGRIPLLLAASQALKAQEPAVTLFLAFDPGAEPIWDEAAWGAVQGGALLAQDLGAEPAAWGALLVQAQAFLPGRPWTLWLPADPGAQLGQLMGDGARLVVPPGGPGAVLASQVPAGFTDVEGGAGTLLLRDPRTGNERHWRFEKGAWASAQTPKDRHEVAVTAKDAYDVGALLAKVRAATIREMLKVRSLEADLEENLHLQASQGPGSDLGFRFRYYQAAGEPQEILQKEVLFNGVKANLGAGLQLPIVESRTSMATPAALTLTERYRYEDGGAKGPGRRKINFEPVDGDTLLFAGSLLVEEATGRILEERSSRSGLPGMVKSEDRIITYQEAAPGFWRVVRTQTFERWVISGAIVQAQRTHVFSNFQFNGPDFAAHRKAAAGSDATMLRSTPDGIRYFVKDKDGSRKVEEKARTSSRGIGAVLLFDPALPTKVLPLAGLAYVDFDAFNKGGQLSVLTAIVFTSAQLSFPNVGAGFDFSASSNISLLPIGESPIRNHQAVSGEAVGRNFASLGLGLAHDLGAGFRFQAKGDFKYDHFSKPLGGQNWTEGYTLPPSGVTSQGTGELSWLAKGFQLVGYYGAGERPDGVYGLPGALQSVPNQGSFTRWGGHAGYDYQLGGMGQWLHFEAGYAGGAGFDRFQSLDVGGLGGDVRVSGIRSNAITADQLTYAKAGLVLPTGPRLRLTLSLDQAWLRSMEDQRQYQVTGLGIAGDLPGFWMFTTVRVDLGIGLLSTLPGVRSFNGFVAFMRVF